MKGLAGWKLYALIAVIIIVVIFAIFFSGKALGRSKARAGKPKPLKFPTGSSIPEGWSPTVDVEQLHGAMKGFGTNENAIWDVLEGKTDAQLAAIYNEFANRYSDDLFEWFRKDLSGDDLRRATNYFRNIA